jgi:hypothetical protein
MNTVGRAGFEPAKVKTNRFTVCPRWPLEYLPLNQIFKNYWLLPSQKPALIVKKMKLRNIS